MTGANNANDIDVASDVKEGEPPFVIEGAEAYLRAMQTLNAKNRPPAILRMIMNAFESYRQARKIGWSRPWNKYGVTTFRSYRIDTRRDDALCQLARDTLAVAAPDLPSDAQAFVDELLSSTPRHRERLMGFIFFHEIETKGQIFEGATLSFGRVHDKKRHRDRLDLVFEAPMSGDQVGPFSKLRIYVDPFDGVKPPLYQAERVGADAVVARDAFEHLCALYPAWENESARLWDHWTSQYIDYFGARRHFASNTHFPVSRTEADSVMQLVGS